MIGKTLALASLLMCLLVACNGRKSHLRSLGAIGRPDWQVKGQQVFKDGKFFWMKGMNYQPVPVGGGAFGQTTVGWGNVGDYINLQWNDVYKRDIPNLREMGVNVLKTYFFWRCAPIANASPQESLSQCKEYLKTNPGLDHKEFLDMLWNDGVDPIFIIIPIAIDLGNTLDNPNIDLMTAYRDFYQWVAQDLALTYGNHPAVLGFTLGNELNMRFANNTSILQTQDFWNALDFVKQGLVTGLTSQGLDPASYLISSPLQDDPAIPNMNLLDSTTTVVKAYESVFNFYMVNAYGGLSPSGTTTADGYRGKLSTPFAYGEWGRPNSDGIVSHPNNATGVATFIDGTVPNIVKDKSWVAGGFFFEYSDEWWKLDCPSCKPYIQNLVPGMWNEEAYGLFSIQNDPSRSPQQPWNVQANHQGAPDILSPLAGVQAFTNIEIPQQ